MSVKRCFIPKCCFPSNCPSFFSILLFPLPAANCAKWNRRAKGPKSQVTPQISIGSPNPPFSNQNHHLSFITTPFGHRHLYFSSLISPYQSPILDRPPQFMLAKPTLLSPFPNYQSPSFLPFLPSFFLPPLGGHSFPTPSKVSLPLVAGIPLSPSYSRGRESGRGRGIEGELPAAYALCCLAERNKSPLRHVAFSVGRRIECDEFFSL